MKAVLTALPLLLAALAGAAPRKALLVGQQPDHPYRTHTYMDDCELIAKCLRQTPGVEAVVSRGWPSDPAALEGVSAVVVHTKLGGDLLFHKDRRDAVSRLLAGGAGLVAIHWGTGAAEPDASGLWFNAMGGWFNAQKGGFSRYKVEASKVRDVADEQTSDRLVLVPQLVLVLLGVAQDHGEGGLGVRVAALGLPLQCRRRELQVERRLPHVLLLVATLRLGGGDPVLNHGLVPLLLLALPLPGRQAQAPQQAGGEQQHHHDGASREGLHGILAHRPHSSRSATAVEP
ncbi:MAG: hypothetical protein ACKORI_05460 [Verrucomicrobiota bacterium]